ncbi:MAG TPA: helix-hairpin-helix domain-containing protein [Thermoanaerobaculia bacterium]
MKTRKRRARTSLLLTSLLLASISALAAADAKPVVNVNTADAKQLSLLPRIGLAVAQRVVDYRKENGPFKSTDELMLVRGIGEKLYAQLKPYVATSGETTLSEKVSSAGRGGRGSSGGKGKGKTSSKARTPRASKTPGAPQTPRASKAPAQTPPKAVKPAHAKVGAGARF